MSKELKEVTLGEIFAWREPISRLVNLDPAPPARVGVQIAKLAREISREFTLVDELRVKIIKKYPDVFKDKNGNPLTNEKHKDYPAAIAELNELFAQKTKVEPFIISLPPDLAVSPQIIFALDQFIDLENGGV